MMEFSVSHCGFISSVVQGGGGGYLVINIIPLDRFFRFNRFKSDQDVLLMRIINSD